MNNGNWFTLCPAAVREKQTDTWNNADEDLQHHMVSSGYGETMS